MAATVLEAAESYISETHVEVGEDVHLLRERFLQIEHETLASSRLEFETNRRASRTYFKGLEEKVGPPENLTPHSEHFLIQT